MPRQEGEGDPDLAGMRAGPQPPPDWLEMDEEEPIPEEDGEDQ